MAERFHYHEQMPEREHRELHARRQTEYARALASIREMADPGITVPFAGGPLTAEQLERGALVMWRNGGRR